MHHLRIETGRYSHNRVDRALPLCTLCDRSDIEDEYHFVLICPVYSQIRQKYIRPFYAPPQKVAGYYVIPSELLVSVRPSVSG